MAIPEHSSLREYEALYAAFDSPLRQQMGGEGVRVKFSRIPTSSEVGS